MEEKMSTEEEYYCEINKEVGRFIKMYEDELEEIILNNLNKDIRDILDIIDEEFDLEAQAFYHAQFVYQNIPFPHIDVNNSPEDRSNYSEIEKSVRIIAISKHANSNDEIWERKEIEEAIFTIAVEAIENDMKIAISKKINNMIRSMRLWNLDELDVKPVKEKKKRRLR